jgi:hypothetical protein
MLNLLRITLAFSLIPSCLAQGSKSESEKSQASKPGSSTESQPPAPTSAPDSQATQQRLQLNLLGQTDAASGEGRRNENVQFNLIDTNTMRELNARVGTTATPIAQFQPDRMVIQGLGPAPPIPVIRAQNKLRYAARLQQLRGSHSWSVGGEVNASRMVSAESSRSATTSAAMR